MTASAGAGQKKSVQQGSCGSCPVEKRSRGVHDGLFRGVGTCNLGCEPALAEDDDPVRDSENLGQFARSHDDGSALRCEPSNERVDLGLGADVDPARRLVEQENFRLDQEPACQDALLLVSAGQTRDGDGPAGCLDRELLDRPADGALLRAD